MFLRLLSHASLNNLLITSLACCSFMLHMLCCARFGGSWTLVIFGFLVSRTVFLSRGYCHPLRAPEDIALGAPAVYCVTCSDSVLIDDTACGSSGSDLRTGHSAVLRLFVCSW